MPDYQVKIYDGMTVRQRQQKANEDGAICYVSIHHNGFSDPKAKGCMVIVGNNASNKSKELAIAWTKHNARLVGTPIRPGTRGDRYFWARDNNNRGNSCVYHTNMPAMLTEGLFLTNPEEAKIALSRAGQKLLALAIAEAIREVFPDGGLVALSPGHNTGNVRNLYGTYIHGHPKDADGAEIYEYHINRKVAEAVWAELSNQENLDDKEEKLEAPDLEVPIGKFGDNRIELHLWKLDESSLRAMIVEEDDDGFLVNEWEIETK